MVIKMQKHWESFFFFLKQITKSDPKFNSQKFFLNKYVIKRFNSLMYQPMEFLFLLSKTAKKKMNAGCSWEKN